MLAGDYQGALPLLQREGHAMLTLVCAALTVLVGLAATVACARESPVWPVCACSATK